MNFSQPTLLSAPRQRLASGLLVWRWWLFLLGCVSAVPLAVWQSDLGMDRSLAAMFAPDDPALLQYQNLQNTFGGNLVVMVVYDDEQLMTPGGVQRNRRLTESVEEISGVAGVLSVAKLVDAFTYLRPPLPMFGTGVSEPALLKSDDPLAISFRGLFAGYTHSEDETTAAIVVMLDGENTQDVIAQLRALRGSIAADRQPVLVGEPILLEDAYDMIEADGKRLAIGTITLLCLVMLVTLRDYRVVVVSVLSIVWTTWFTRAAMVILGIELSLVSTILVAIVAVIAVAAIMHVGIRCRTATDDADANRSPNGHAIFGAIAFLAMPILWTCLTDAAGFVSLLSSDVRPVRQFGAMTAIAAMGIPIAFVWFTPAMMSLPKGPVWLTGGGGTSPVGRLRGRDSRGSRAIQKLVRGSVRNGFRITWMATVALFVCVGLVTRLPTETSFLTNFRSDSEIVRAYDRVEKRLGGAGVWDVILPAPASITPTYIQRVGELEQRLRDIRVTDAVTGQTFALTKVLSLADADQVAEQSPLLSLLTPEIRLAGMRTAIPTFADALLTFEKPAGTNIRQMRIMLRSEESMPGEIKPLFIDEVTRLANQAFPDAAVTGYSVLMSRMVGGLVRDQWKALAIAFGLVGLLVGIATGSWWQAIAALMTNALPVMLILAGLGTFGGGLDLGSAMIGAVSIGLSVDGSIHFLVGYQRARQSGRQSSEAALLAASDIALPILLATLALVVGFAILMTSPFVPTVTFGKLIAATLAVSSLVNLTVLPAAIVTAERFSRRRSNEHKSGFESQ